MAALHDCVVAQFLTDGYVDSEKLLAETASGDQSEFMERIRQHISEIRTFLGELKSLY